MQTLSFPVILISLALLALLLVFFIVGRIIYLGTRIGAFRTLLRYPGQDSWHRGYARYGQFNMAWSGLVRLSFKPDLLLPRESLELVGEPLHDKWAGTTSLRLRAGENEYGLVLSTADYTGLVSWIDSAPPREAPMR